MQILGLDPGTATTGYGLVCEEKYQMRALCHGVVRTESSTPMHRRLFKIHNELLDVLKEHGADAVAVEKLYFNKNVQSAMKVGQARGVILLTAAIYDAEVLEYTPSEVKMAVTGHGRAPKDQVGNMVGAALKMRQKPTPDDAADALAVAVCGLRKWQWERTLEGGK